MGLFVFKFNDKVMILDSNITVPGTIFTVTGMAKYIESINSYLCEAQCDGEIVSVWVDENKLQKLGR